MEKLKNMMRVNLWIDGSASLFTSELRLIHEERDRPYAIAIGWMSKIDKNSITDKKKAIDINLCFKIMMSCLGKLE